MIIVNYRTPELTQRCLAALRSERDLLPKLKAVVVDGGSGDDSPQRLAKTVADPAYRNWVTFLPLSVNGGFGWANNQAILSLAGQESPPEFIYLLNPDAEVQAGAVNALVEELLNHSRCGAAGSQLIDADGQLAGSAFRFPSPVREFTGSVQSEVLGRILRVPSLVIRSAESAEVDWVTGASVMFRSAALRQTGLFDDGFFLYFEEVELMHRLRERGWGVRHVPTSRVAHLEGVSTGVGSASASRRLPEFWYRSRRRYFALTGGALTVLAANFCWLAGNPLFLLKRVLGRPVAGQRPSALALVRNGMWPRRDDFSPSVPRWGDPPGSAPAWMKGE
jgi:N-acetylglucosaminyl-diphospho-decaprenol L-rhamnosyltransferase